MPPWDTVGVIGLIMLFIRATMGHSGCYRVSNVIRTFHHVTQWALQGNNVIRPWPTKGCERLVLSVVEEV